MPPPLRPVFPGLGRSILRPGLITPALVAPTGVGGKSLEELVDELRRLRAEMNRSVYRSGVILRELSQPGRITEANVTDFPALLARFDLGSPMSAAKYIAVAESFSEEEAAQLGVERGYAIVRGAHAMPQPIAPRALLAQNPTIAVPSGTHPLRVAPLRSILEWVSTLRISPTPAPSTRMYKEVDSVRDKLHRRFAAAGIAQSKMRVVRRGASYVVRVELAAEDAATLVRLVKPSK